MIEETKNLARFHALRGTILVALSGILYGTLAYFGTMLIREDFSIPTMLFWRFLFAAAWMFLSSWSVKKNIFKNCVTPEFIKIMVLGVITYSASSAFYFMSSQYIGTGVAMVIFFCYPVFIVLFVWMLTNWRMNKQTFLALIAVIVGLIFLKDNDQHTLNLFGILLGIFGAVVYAIYVYLNQNTAKSIDSRLQTIFICLGNALIFLMISYSTHSFIVPHTISSWVYICAFAIIATALPIQLVLDGLKYISPIKASILSVLEPVVTVLIGLMLLNETVSTMQTIGIVVILLGAILIQFEKVDNLQHEVSS